MGSRWISASPHALHEFQGDSWLYYSPHHGFQKSLSSDVWSTSSPSFLSLTLFSCVFTFSFSPIWEKIVVGRFVCSQAVPIEKFLQGFAVLKGWSCLGSLAGNCSLWSPPLPRRWHHSAPVFMWGTEKEKLLPPPLPFCSQYGWLKAAKQAKFTVSCAEMAAPAWSQLYGPSCVATPGAGRAQTPPPSEKEEKNCMCYFSFLNKSSQKHY